VCVVRKREQSPEEAAPEPAAPPPPRHHCDWLGFAVADEATLTTWLLGLRPLLGAAAAAAQSTAPTPTSGEAGPLEERRSSQGGGGAGDEWQRPGGLAAQAPTAELLEEWIREARQAAEQTRALVLQPPAMDAADAERAYEAWEAAEGGSVSPAPLTTRIGGGAAGAVSRAVGPLSVHSRRTPLTTRRVSRSACRLALAPALGGLSQQPRRARSGAAGLGRPRAAGGWGSGLCRGCWGY
jgi:hypothetical protein